MPTAILFGSGWKNIGSSYMENLTSIKPVSEVPDQVCTDLEFLFTDIDDTITKDGMMPYETLRNMYQLQKSGIKVVLVTGRPAGWCDYFARMWPVAAVIGENGAFYFSYHRSEKSMKRVFLVSEEERKKNRVKLDLLKEKVLAEVPGCRISADQPFRIADLAIDIREDVEPLSDESLDTLCRIITRMGAGYKISSIHVNCWYGTYDKLSCFNVFLKDYAAKSVEQYQDRILYVGDSPNDEPMFRGLKNTVAVANIRAYESILKSPPLYITTGQSADGFKELVRTILVKRGNHIK